MINSVKFDKEYYEDGIRSGKSCYEDYKWIPTRSIEEAKEVEYLFMGEGTILDYGCAKGFLVHALRLLGNKAFGEDISDYAITNCHPGVKRYVSKVTTKKYDNIFCKDVLEHIPERQLQGILKMLLGRGRNFFFIIPLADEGRYRIPVYEYDKTHVIKHNEEWWLKQFKKAGYKLLNFSYTCDNLKKHWTKDFPYGNGFFDLTK